MDVRADGTLTQEWFVAPWEPIGPGRIRARAPGANWSREYTLKSMSGEDKAIAGTFTFVDYLDPTTRPSDAPAQR